MLGSIYEKGVVEKYDGPWVSLVGLYSKPYQENVPCNEYQCMMCVSYQNLYQVTRTFAFPIPLYNDAVQDIDT